MWLIHKMKCYCIKQHGFKTSITKIREVAGTDKQGTNVYGVIKAAEQLGFSAKGVFRRFFHLLKPQKRLLLHIFIASLILTILGILGSFYFKVLMDDILADSLLKTLHIVSIGVILLNLFKVLLGAVRSHLFLYLSQKLDIVLLLGYYNHVLELPMNFFGTRKVGEIISRFNDGSKVREAISGATLTIMIDTLMVIAGGLKPPMTSTLTQDSYMV